MNCNSPCTSLLNHLYYCVPLFYNVFYIWSYLAELSTNIEPKSGKIQFFYTELKSSSENEKWPDDGEKKNFSTTFSFCAAQQSLCLIKWSFFPEVVLTYDVKSQSWTLKNLSNKRCSAQNFTVIKPNTSRTLGLFYRSSGHLTFKPSNPQTFKPSNPQTFKPSNIQTSKDSKT